MGRGRKEEGQWVPAAPATAREGSGHGVEERRGGGVGKGWRGGTGVETGERGHALGPAVQLRQPTHSSPLGLRGKPEGVPERKGRAGSAPQGQGRTPTEPSPDTGLTSQLPRAPRPAPVESEEPSGRAGPGRVGAGDREGRGRAAGPLLGPAPWSPARRAE